MKYIKPIAIFSFIIVLSVSAWFGWKYLNTPVYDTTKMVSYSFTLKNKTNQVIKNPEFWTYAPVTQNSSQQCCKQLEVSHPYEVENDALGNQVLHFKLDPLPPFAVRVIRVKAEIQLASTPNKQYGFKPKGFVNKEPFLEIDHADIKAVASNMRTETTLQTSRKTYDWVAKNVRDIGYLRDARGALYALQNKQGDCTESAYLFVALARANGIKARAVGGYFMENNGLLRATQYHEWAEFYQDSAWHIADPQKKVYDQFYSNYVAMHIVDNSNDSVFKFARFRHSGKGLKVKMN